MGARATIVITHCTARKKVPIESQDRNVTNQTCDTVLQCHKGSQEGPQKILRFVNVGIEI